MRIREDNGRLAIAIEFDDIGFVVLRDQQAAVFGADDAVAIVAGILPEKFPLRARGDDAGNRGDGNFARRRAGCGEMDRGHLARRILAGGKSGVIAGIGVGLKRRRRRVYGSGWQRRSLTLSECDDRSEQA